MHSLAHGGASLPVAQLVRLPGQRAIGQSIGLVIRANWLVPRTVGMTMSAPQALPWFSSYIPRHPPPRTHRSIGPWGRTYHVHQVHLMPKGWPGAKEPSREHAGGVCEGRLLTVWLSSSFLSAGLSVWEAAFLLTEQEANQLLEDPYPSRRLCVDTLGPQRTPWRDLTCFEAPIWFVAKCPGLCWSQDPGHKTGHVGRERPRLG